MKQREMNEVMGEVEAKRVVNGTLIGVAHGNKGEVVVDDSRTGQPLTGDEHCVAVWMPKFQDIVHYGEKNEAFLKKMTAGYPRFVLHPQVLSLFQKAKNRFAEKLEKMGEVPDLFVFPSLIVAKRCLEFIDPKGDLSAIAEAFEWEEFSLGVVTFPKQKYLDVKRYWQHTGEIISSRQAAQINAILEENRATPTLSLYSQTKFIAELPAAALEAANHQTSAKVALDAHFEAELRVDTLSLTDSLSQILINRIWSLNNAFVRENIFLFGTGMAAIFCVHRTLRKMRRGKMVQIGYPYIDTMKMHESFGEGVHLLKGSDDEIYQGLLNILREGPVAGVFLEVPSNPLLRTFDLPRLSSLTKYYSTPLVVDDSMAMFSNCDFTPYADIHVASLTKYFIGSGNAMGGVAHVSSSLRPFFLEEYRGTLESLATVDLVEWEKGQRDFLPRMKKINFTALALCQWLIGLSVVQKIYYPFFENKSHYQNLLLGEGSGFGGVFSLLFDEEQIDTAKFYDALDLFKGASFGMQRTLVCPYVLLAHFNELEMVEKEGMDKNLLRFSVGLEDFLELKRIIELAIKKAMR